MTTRDRAGQVKDVSVGMLEYLDRMGSSFDAGTLLRDYCKEENVDPTLAEMALLVLLNDGSIQANRELKLEKRPVEAA